MNDAIIKTICYFDIFNTPLTREEIFRWLWESNSNDFKILISELEKLTTQKIIEYKNGYYFLPNRADTIEIRERTIPYVEKKMSIAVRACKKLRYVPFLEAVFVCNTVAGGGVKENSDIDVFIVIKKGRLWLSRFLSTILLSIFRLRRNKKQITDKICLSFYATDDNLDLSKISIAQPDIYLAYWIDNLIPVYDPKNFRRKIVDENKWAKKYLPNAFGDFDTLHRWLVTDSKISKCWRSFFEKSWQGSYGDLVEKQAKEIQNIKMKMNITNANKPDNVGVIITDSMLKFHENDRREYFKNEWLKKYSTILNSKSNEQTL